MSSDLSPLRRSCRPSASVLHRPPPAFNAPPYRPSVCPLPYNILPPPVHSPSTSRLPSVRPPPPTTLPPSSTASPSTVHPPPVHPVHRPPPAHPPFAARGGWLSGKVLLMGRLITSYRAQPEPACRRLNGLPKQLQPLGASPVQVRTNNMSTVEIIRPNIRRWDVHWYR